MLCLPKPDPIVEVMCAGDGPLALVVFFDPMLEELLAAAFVASCSVVAAASPRSVEPTPVVAVSSHQPSAQELVQLTPPRVGQTDVDIGDDTPTPREAARCLARILDEVWVVREPPLVSSSPRQRVRSKRPLPIRHRNRRIAVQPLAHIPASR